MTEAPINIGLEGMRSLGPPASSPANEGARTPTRPPTVPGENPFTVRWSERARRISIVVTPGGVEVVAPPGTDEERIAAFVAAKRRWIYERERDLAARAAEIEASRRIAAGPERWVSGAKVPFRGRRLLLRVVPDDVERAELRYATAFHVRVPRAATAPERERLAESVVRAWLLARAREDARLFVLRHAERLGRSPLALRISPRKRFWGSCSADGTIYLDPRLVAAPRPVFEYVVVHELCHLEVRHHGPAFWRLLATLLPGYEVRKAWLDRHGGGVE